MVMAHTDDLGADDARPFDPPNAVRPTLPAPAVSAADLPPPVVSDRQRLANGSPPAAVPKPVVAPETVVAEPIVAAEPVVPEPDLRTDEIDVMAEDGAPINRTTILKSPGFAGNRLSSTATSLPDRPPTERTLADLVATTSPIPPPPPPTRRTRPLVDRAVSTPNVAPASSVSPDPLAVGQPRPETSSVDDALVPSRPPPVERPITVPPRRDESFVSRSAAANPFPTHAPPMIIRRTRRRSGLGLIVTLALLGGLIAAAVVFGRPLLFPDGWSETARPYGEAVEASQGIEFDDPPDLSEVPPDAHQRGMLDRFGGSWQAELPMWRSLGLASNNIDEPTLAGLLADWQPAYFDPNGNRVVVDDTATGIDAHIVTAMSVGALDQRFRWKARRDNAGLELGVLIDAQVRALARESSADTAFGVAADDRPIAVASFLPPVLAYRIHAPLAFGDLVPGDVSAPESIAPMSSLGTAPEARLNEGDVLDATHATDRAFWYLVFAGYVDARRAYDASNGLSLAMLTTATRGDVTCSYATFGGASPEQTAQIASMLDDWAAAAPGEMSASARTRADGVVQLRSCDPGAGFEMGTRFGVARELARWRLVELAVRERALTIGTDASAAIARGRQSGAAAPLLSGGFDVAPEVEREAARSIARDLVGG